MYNCNRKLLIALMSLMGVEMVTEAIVVGITAGTVDSTSWLPISTSYRPLIIIISFFRGAYE